MTQRLTYGFQSGKSTSVNAYLFRRYHISSICWFCGEIIIHHKYNNPPLKSFCRIVHSSCMHARLKGKQSVNYGRMNNTSKTRTRLTSQRRVKSKSKFVLNNTAKCLVNRNKMHIALVDTRNIGGYD